MRKAFEKHILTLHNVKIVLTKIVDFFFFGFSEIGIDPNTTLPNANREKIYSHCCLYLVMINFSLNFTLQNSL